MTSRSKEPTYPRPGLPLNGSTGAWLGRDADGRPWLLVWHPRGEWNALGYESPTWPIMHRNEAVAARIVEHEPIDATSRARPLALF